jgi:hypothetical protein
MEMVVVRLGYLHRIFQEKRDIARAINAYPLTIRKRFSFSRSCGCNTFLDAAGKFVALAVLLPTK